MICVNNFNVILNPLPYEFVDIFVLLHILDEIPSLLPDSPHCTEHTDSFIEFTVAVQVELIWVVMLNGLKQIRVVSIG